MMQNLLLQEGDLLTVESTSLQVASYSKFEPQSVEFLDISNPKAVYPFMYWPNGSLIEACSLMFR